MEFEPNEEFKTCPVNGFLLTSQYGKIKNKNTDQIMEPIQTRGYAIVIDPSNNNPYEKVDRLVAFTWLDGWQSQMVVHHKDGNTFNNRADNLEWVTSEELEKLLKNVKRKEKEYTMAELREMLNKPPNGGKNEPFLNHNGKFYHECTDSTINGEEFFHFNDEIEVSNFGRVKYKGEVLLQTIKQEDNHRGYLYVRIPEEQDETLVHQLVAGTFLEWPSSEWHVIVVHHKNGNTYDNRIENLLYVTCEQHAKIHNYDEQRCGSYKEMNKCYPWCVFKPVNVTWRIQPASDQHSNKKEE